MKVLFISHEDSKYGAPRSLMDLVKTLRDKHGVTPIVLLHSHDDVYEFCQKEKIECYIVGHRNFVCGKKTDFMTYVKWLPKKILNILGDYKALQSISHYIDMNSIDIVHSNVTVISLGELLKKKYNIKHIVHLRESDNYIESYLIAKSNFIKFLNNNSDAFIAISDFNRKGWSKQGIDENKTFTIYNGLKPLNFNNKQEKKSGPIKIVISGAVTPEKGQYILLEALTFLNQKAKDQIHVDIIGSGSRKYLQKLKKYCYENNIDNIVEFKGYVENICEKYHYYDVGIMASKAEAFGRVTVEYMMNGLIVLASNSGANPEIVDNWNDGLLFVDGDSKDLSQKINYIVTHWSECRKFGERAREKSIKKFSTEMNASSIYNVYCKLRRKR